MTTDTCVRLSTDPHVYASRRSLRRRIRTDFRVHREAYIDSLDRRRRAAIIRNGRANYTIISWLPDQVGAYDLDGASHARSLDDAVYQALQRVGAEGLPQ